MEKEVLPLLKGTHIAVGLAVTLSILPPKSPGECALALLGGAIGSAVCDIDIHSSAHKADAFWGRIAALIIAVCALLYDRTCENRILTFILSQPHRQLLVGFGAFLTLMICFMLSGHRGFSHSLLAVVLITAAATLICAPAAPYFAIGIAAHIALDLFNRTGLRLFWPMKKRICFHVFYADRIANGVCLIAGVAVSVIRLIACIARP